MSRSTRTAVVRRFVHSQTTVTVVAAATAGALVVGLMAAGASSAIAAAPDYHSMLDSTLYPQTVAPAGTENAPSSDGLKVTVGKAVSVTTDAAGKPGPIVELVTNTQVSGNGSGTVTVPIGTNKATNTGTLAKIETANNAMIYNVNSGSSQVQNLHASAGTYSGPMDVSLQVNAWLNGQPIDPNKLVNVTGDVKIDYVFSNNTSAEEEVSYTNTQGQPAKAKVSLPAPMAAAFQVVYGNGWANISAPWANTGISNTGQQLNGTVILFPPLGKTSSTLSVTATANKGTLPFSTTTAIPLNFGTLMGGLILSVPPKIENGLEKVDGLVSRVPGMMVFAEQLLNKYAGVAADMDARYVQPIVGAVEKVDITPSDLDGKINAISKAAADLGTLLEANGQVDFLTADAIKPLARALANSGKSIAEIQKILDKFAADLEFLSGATGKAEAGLVAMGRLLVDLPIDVESCSLGNATNNTYLGGANAILKQAAKNPAATPADRTALSALVTVLNSQSQLIGGQLPISACAAYSFALQKVLDFLAKAAPEAQALAEKLKVVEADLAFFAALVAGISPELDKVVAPLVKISKILDNPACPTSIQAFKAQGLKAIKNCGLVQGIDLIGLINKFAGTALNKKVAPLVLSLQKYVPTIIKLEGLAKKDVPALGAKFAAIPGTLDKFAEMVGGFVPKVDSAGNAITNGVDKLAILNASLVAMNQKTLNGDNIPYGNATGPAGTTVTMAAWQINQNGAGETGKDLSLNLGIALILFLIAGGVGTAMYRHRRSS